MDGDLMMNARYAEIKPYVVHIIAIIVLIQKPGIIMEEKNSPKKLFTTFLKDVNPKIFLDYRFLEEIH